MESEVPACPFAIDSFRLIMPVDADMVLGNLKAIPCVVGKGIGGISENHQFLPD